MVSGRRLRALVKKEFLQLYRDKSSLLIGIALPIMLIFIIGYGISMDVKNVPTAVVLGDRSPLVRDMLSFLNGSEYFQPYFVDSLAQATQLMEQRSVDAIIYVPENFTADFYAHRSSVQIILYGVEAALATTCKGYIEGALGQWLTMQQGQAAGNIGTVAVVSRMWFNDANTSTWYFVPGLMVIISSLVGVLLTALVMAREYERGTLESLFITPVRVIEIIVGKMIPYFCLALVGFCLCLTAAVFMFDVPLHGSLAVMLVGTTLFLLVALGAGLLISVTTKNQFMACQIALVSSMLPTVMLTGFLFDLRSVPWWVRAVGQILPQTYYMQLLKSLFLAGNNWPLIIKNCMVLFLYGSAFLGLAWKLTRKRLE